MNSLSHTYRFDPPSQGWGTFARMLRHMETIPGFKEIPQMPWYPDKSYSGDISRAQREVRSRQ